MKSIDALYFELQNVFNKVPYLRHWLHIWFDWSTTGLAELGVTSYFVTKLRNIITFLVTK